MTSDHVFPEDAGTGAPSGDAADAANFGALAQHDLLSDYKATGLDVTVDFTNLAFDLTAGKAFIGDDAAATAQTQETRDQGVLYTVEVAPRTGVPLTDASLNEVFINFDLTVDDGVSVTVTTDGTTPPNPFLKIAEIDTATDTLDENYNNSLDVTGKDVIDGATLIYDSSESHIPQETIEQGAGSTLDADTVDGIEATDLGSNISNTGTKVTNSATDIDFQENLKAVDDGDGTSTVSLFDPPSLSRGINFSDQVIATGETFDVSTSDDGLISGELSVQGTLNIEGSLKIN